jgi:hypothetical protein
MMTWSELKPKLTLPMIAPKAKTPLSPSRNTALASRNQNVRRAVRQRPRTSRYRTP